MPSELENDTLGSRPSNQARSHFRLQRPLILVVAAIGTFRDCYKQRYVHPQLLLWFLCDPSTEYFFALDQILPSICAPESMTVSANLHLRSTFFFRHNVADPYKFEQKPYAFTQIHLNFARVNARSSTTSLVADSTDSTAFICYLTVAPPTFVVKRNYGYQISLMAISEHKISTLLYDSLTAAIYTCSVLLSAIRSVP